MAELRKQLTPLQKAAICLAAVENIDDWKLIYLIAKNQDYTNDDLRTSANIASRASSFKHDPRTMDYYNTVRARLDAAEMKRARAGVAALRNEDETKTGADDSADGKQPRNAPEIGLKIDFKNREEFINYLNLQVNACADDKQRIDYLKMLADLQRYKEQKPDQNDDIQRFYTPLTCSNCALYKESSKQKK